ncbi:MAG: histidine phosphatase family protein, partial [Nocardioides sp.]
PVTVVDDLREHERESTEWCDDFAGAVRRAFARPERAAAVGWEPLAALRDRLVPAVRRILDAVPPEDGLVLAGHGTAWTLLVAELTGNAPDLDAWQRLAMPDVLVVDLGRPTGGRRASHPHDS